MKVKLTLKSKNEKTGPIACSMSSRNTCPSACPFYSKGCYGLGGNCRIHWNRVNEKGDNWDLFCSQVEQVKGMLRHNVVGDLPGFDNAINGSMLWKLTKAIAKGKVMAYTYTHKPVLSTRHAINNRRAIAKANRNGFCVNLSANSLDNADKLSKLNIGPVVVVLPKGAPNKTKTPQGQTVIKCPAQVKDDITCETCKLCARIDRKVIVGFEAHGCAAKTVSEIVK